MNMEHDEKQASTEGMKTIEQSTAESEKMSVWFRRRINRVFREHGDIKDIPHPEVDTRYERIRSRFVRFFFVVADRFHKIFYKGQD